MPLVIALAAVGFLLLHVALWRAREPDYNRAFKMARGLAALVLSGLGFAGLVDASEHWRVGFLYRHEPDDWMLAGVSVAYGHFLADFASMLYGRVALGVAPRRDLIAHHGLGLLAYGIAMVIDVGWALVLVSLASELMPCCTGLEAWGKHLARPELQRAGSRGRLWVLLLWRLPLWAFTMTMLARTVLADEVPEGLGLVWGFVMVCLAILIGLDVYWTRKSAAAPRGGPSPEGPS